MNTTAKTNCLKTYSTTSQQQPGSNKYAMRSNLWNENESSRKAYTRTRGIRCNARFNRSSKQKNKSTNYVMELNTRLNCVVTVKASRIETSLCVQPAQASGS